MYNLREKVESRFKDDFITIPIGVVEKICAEWIDNIVMPTIDIDLEAEILRCFEDNNSITLDDIEEDIYLKTAQADNLTDRWLCYGAVKYTKPHKIEGLGKIDGYLKLCNTVTNEKIKYYTTKDETFEKCMIYEGLIMTKEEIENVLNTKRDELYNNIYDIMWGYLFITNDSYLANLLRDNVNNLYELGITLIECEGTLQDFGEVMMGVRGCGFDFYEEIWIPLYTKVLKFIEPKTPSEEYHHNFNEVRSSINQLYCKYEHLFDKSVMNHIKKANTEVDKAMKKLFSK